MKTTLNIDDRVMVRLKREAARQNKTMSELVETALRLLLRQTATPQEPVELPSFTGGQPRIDVNDRQALYQVMEDR